MSNQDATTAQNNTFVSRAIYVMACFLVVMGLGSYGYGLYYNSFQFLNKLSHFFWPW